MRRTVIALAIVLLVAPAAPFLYAQSPPPAGAAQSTNPPAEEPDGFLEPWIGFHFSGGIIDAVKDHDTTTKAYGVTLGFLQRGFVGGELELGYTPNYFSDALSSIVGGNNLLTLTGSMMLGPWIRFTDQQAVRPYVVIGGGLARSKIEDFVRFGDTTKNRGVIDYGGGVNIYFAKHIGVRGDVRFMRDVGRDACADGDLICESTGGWGVTSTRYQRMHVGVLLAF